MTMHDLPTREEKNVTFDSKKTARKNRVTIIIISGGNVREP